MPGLPVTKDTTYKLAFDGDLVATQYSENMGTATVTPGAVNLLPSAIPTQEAFGSPTLTPGAAFVSPGGIVSDEAFGTPQLNLVILPTSIGSGEAFGTPTLIPGAVVISGAGNISSAEAFGLAKILNAIRPVGIASGEAFGIVIVKRVPFKVTSKDIVDYRVVIAGLDGIELEEVPFKNLQFSYILNEAGAIAFTLPLVHAKSTPDLIAPGEREIRVYRNGVRVWGGYLWIVGVSSSDDSIRISGDGYYSRLMRRHIDQKLTYETVDQIDIAWNIIDWTQSQPDGALGITRHAGSTPSGKLRTRRYKPWERVNIGEEIQDLASLADGFDFQITPYKEFRTYSPYRGADNGVVFDLNKNIQTISYDRDATGTVTELSGMGAGDGRNRCIAVVSTANGLAQFGLLQEVEDFSHVRYYPDLVDKTTEALRLIKGLRINPQVVIQTDDPPFEDYQIGDECKIRAIHGYMNLNKKFRAVSQVVQLSDAGREVSQLFFDKVLSE